MLPDALVALLPQPLALAVALALALAAVPVLLACGTRAGGDTRDDAARRADMVRSQLEARDITDPAVLAALRKVPRHEFVPPSLAAEAYTDKPLPIGLEQTISQPYIVALMTQLARVAPGKKALDVGTGSGYQAAVLAETCREVYTVEILCDLAEEARQRLQKLGYRNITGRCGDGWAGWPEAAPFDVIVVAAAPPEIPEPLIRQLAPGGRLVIPVGGVSQELVVVEKGADGAVRRWSAGGVRFVPMTGEAQRQP